MRRPRRLLALAVAATALLLAPLAPASGQSAEQKKKDVDSALAEQKVDLHESSAALAEATEALQRVAVQLPAARARFAAALARLDAAREEHARTEAELRGASFAVSAAEQATAAAKARLDARRQAIGDIARAAYMQGRLGYVAVALEAQTPSDFLDRTKYLDVVLDDQDRALDEASLARAELAARTASLQERRDALDRRERAAAQALAAVGAAAAEADAARRSVEAQVATRDRARRVAERERAADLARYRALVAESRRLADLIRREAQSRGTGRIGKGGLLWPTPGPVTSRYGYRTHPIYGYRRFHAGIDIGAPSGQAIVAVRAGRVVHAGAMGTYGNLVVIDHGNGFSTAYAHQSRVAVGDGARVGRGQVIGYVGSTGASTGPHLHFETRVNGEPVDPMRYY